MSEPEIPDPWVEAAAEAIGLADGYDIAADPTSTIARELGPQFTEMARAALSAAYPLMERALKAKALREAADTMVNGKGVAYDDVLFAGWLRDRADALEEEA